MIKKSDEKVNKPRKLRGRVTEFDLSVHIFLAQIILRVGKNKANMKN